MRTGCLPCQLLVLVVNQGVVGQLSSLQAFRHPSCSAHRPGLGNSMEWRHVIGEMVFIGIVLVGARKRAEGEAPEGIAKGRKKMQLREERPKKKEEKRQPRSVRRDENAYLCHLWSFRFLNLLKIKEIYLESCNPFHQFA